MVAHKLRILVIGEAVTASHVLRPLQIANQLVSDDFKVCFSCDRKFKPDNIHKDVNFFHLNSIAPEVFQSRLKKGRPAYTKSELASYVGEETHLIERIKPDIIISDFRISLCVSAQVTKVYHISLANAQWSPLGDLRVPVPEHPLVDYVGVGISEFILNKFKKKIFSSHLKPMNNLRKENKLIPFETIEELYSNGNITLYMDSPELFNITENKKDHDFIGPIHCVEDQSLPSWWYDLPKGNPFIFISPGSSGDEKATLKIIKTLSEMNVTVMLATAGKINRKDVDFKNVFTAKFLPGLAAAERADLIICNGGSGMVYLGLSQSTPILCIPTLMDQFLVSNAIVNKGAGLLIRPSRLKNSVIQKSVMELLSDSSYSKEAGELSTKIKGFDYLKTIKDIINAQVQAKVKVGHLTKRLNLISLGSKEEVFCDLSAIEIKIATEPEELKAAYQLVYKQYLEKGYTAEIQKKTKISFWNTLPNTCTLIAKSNNCIVGTLSFIKDSIAGLPMDEVSNSSLDVLRKDGRHLCELAGLAIDGSACEKNTVMKLFQFGLKLSMNHLKVTDYVITVNPRHRFFYNKMLCFNVIGETCSYQKVEYAPAVPMRLNLLTAWEVYSKKYQDSIGDKNLHEFFFINDQEFLDEGVSFGVKKRNDNECSYELIEFYKNEVALLRNSHYYNKFHQLWDTKLLENREGVDVRKTG